MGGDVCGNQTYSEASTCGDINECDGSNPCGNGTCNNSVPGYSCECDAGYEPSDDGLTCENINDCADVNCNNGECVDEVESYYCDCADGWDGDACDNDINECADVNCNNGECVDEIAGYYCSCQDGWDGDACDNNIDDCTEVNCNNGECVDEVASYYCDCVDGWDGDACDNDIDDCADVNCNNGECIDEIASYYCSCTEGWDGDVCDNNIDDCADVTCDNGECVDEVAGYYCDCATGYELSGGGIAYFHDQMENGEIGPEDFPIVEPDVMEGWYTSGSASDTSGAAEGRYQLRTTEGGFGLGGELRMAIEATLANETPPLRIAESVSDVFFTTSVAWGSSDYPTHCRDREGSLVSLHFSASGGIDKAAVRYSVLSQSVTEDAMTIGGSLADFETGGGELTLEILQTATNYHVQVAVTGEGDGVGCNLLIDDVTVSLGDLSETICTNIDECNEGTASCTDNSSCVDTEGWYECPCNDGYQEAGEEGELCENIDECDGGIASCPDNSTCDDTSPGYECPCDSGYEPTGGDLYFSDDFANGSLGEEDLPDVEYMDGKGWYFEEADHTSAAEDGRYALRSGEGGFGEGERSMAAAVSIRHEVPPFAEVESASRVEFTADVAWGPGEYPAHCRDQAETTTFLRFYGNNREVTAFDAHYSVSAAEVTDDWMAIGGSLAEFEGEVPTAEMLREALNFQVQIGVTSNGLDTGCTLLIDNPTITLGSGDDLCTNIDDCVENDCHQLCIDGLNTYTCDCYEYWDFSTEEGAEEGVCYLNECEAGEYECPERAHCVDVLDGYDCECEEGWELVHGACHIAPTAIALDPSEVDENSEEDTEVGLLTSEDPEEGDWHTYEILNEEEVPFRVGYRGEGGTVNPIDRVWVLYVDGDLNHEEKDEWVLMIETTDPWGLTYKDEFTITIIDVNEPTESLEDTRFEIEENVEVGTFVAWLIPDDEDEDSDYDMGIVEGYDEGFPFEIKFDDEEGAWGIYTAGPLNYERQDWYEALVWVEDPAYVEDGPSFDFYDDISIEIIDVNDAPVAVDDAYFAVEDEPLVAPGLGLLVNDWDEDREPRPDTLTVYEFEQASHGDVGVPANGLFVYTPDHNFHGEDSFRYRITDSDDEPNISNWATVTITVRPRNDNPVAVDDLYSIEEGGTLEPVVSEELNQGLLANDWDVDTDLESEGTPESELTNLTVLEILTDVPEGSGTLTVDDVDGSFKFVSTPGWTDSVTFTYVITDGHPINPGVSNVATVTISIDNVNDAPIAVDDRYWATEDLVFNTAGDSVIDNDSDPDLDPLTADVVTTTSNGSLDFLENGRFRYTPEPHWSGTDSFTYTVTDGELTSNTATVYIVVAAVPDTPIAQDDEYEIDEDTVLIANGVEENPDGVLENDDIIEEGTLTARLLDPPLSGSVEFNEDGTFEYTPEDDFNGYVSFTYVALNGEAMSNVATVRINVVGLPDAPTAMDDDYAAGEDETLSVEAPLGVLANDYDPDGDELIAVLDTETVNGHVTLNENGSFSYVPENNFVGTDSFTYHAIDGIGDGALSSDVVTVTIRVTTHLDAPFASDDEYGMDEDDTLVVDAPGVLENDTDADEDELTVSLDSEPLHGELTLNEDGSFTYTPEENWNGIDSFTYITSDETWDSNIGTVEIIVAPVNDPPVLVDPTPTEDIDAVEGTPVNFTVLAEDVDGDTIAYSLVGAPTGARLGVDSGLFTWTPTFDQAGVWIFEVVATSDGPFSDAREIIITVVFIDTDGDGIPDTFETLAGGEPGNNDADGDTISDNDELENWREPTDTDGDGIYDFVDLDSDNDGINDDIEAGDDDLDTYPVDTDDDGTPDWRDLDSDGDGVFDEFDICVYVSDSEQEDMDEDGIGDACDDDIDGDDLSNELEEEWGLDPLNPDSDGDGLSDTYEWGEEDDEPADSDDDGEPDAIEVDSDDDGYLDEEESLGDEELFIDTDEDGLENYRDPDSDNDGVDDVDDNCPLVENADQEDTDEDGFGDECDEDNDGDGVLDDDDNCPIVVNSDQFDTDEDGEGDECDSDDDGDGVVDNDDNCQFVENERQADLNDNGIGDQCEDGFELLAQGGGAECSAVPTASQNVPLVGLLMTVFGLFVLRRRRNS